jgi:thioredoxin 1
MAEQIVSVADSDFDREVIQASRTQPVMVDFWAEWCRPCLMLAPTVEQIAREYAGRVKVLKMNVDENMNTPARFNIRSIPTLLIFKDGKVAGQIVGAVPAEHIRRALDGVLA